MEKFFKKKFLIIFGYSLLLETLEALGAALSLVAYEQGKARIVIAMMICKDLILGKNYSQDQIENELKLHW